MKIASFDIGTKNLACCVLEKETESIFHWEVFDISTTRKGAVGKCKKMVNLFDNCDPLQKIDEVVIEIQPSFNPKAKAVQHFIVSYFATRFRGDIKITEFSSHHKLSCYVGEDAPDYSHLKSEYAQRKKLGIFHTKEIIEGRGGAKVIQSDIFRKMFEGSRKKDDLADSFLQGLCYIRYEEQAKEPVPQNLTPRRPRKRQNNFSKNNLKWLITHALETHEIVEVEKETKSGIGLEKFVFDSWANSDKRIRRALKKFLEDAPRQVFLEKFVPERFRGENCVFSKVKKSPGVTRGSKIEAEPFVVIQVSDDELEN